MRAVRYDAFQQLPDLVSVSAPACPSSGVIIQGAATGLCRSDWHETAASLGCRFATAYRAVVYYGRVEEGGWVAAHGCGGVGLSAVMIGARD